MGSEYTLIPTKNLSNITNNSDPAIQLNTSIEPLHKTSVYRVNELEKSSRNILTSSEKSPEITLKLYNFLNNLYKTSIDLENNKNSEESPIIDNELRIQNIVDSIPVLYRKKAALLLNKLVDKEEIIIGKKGILKNILTGEHISGSKLVMNILKRKVDENNDFYRNLLGKYSDLHDIPKASIKKIKGGTRRPMKIQTNKKKFQWLRFKRDLT